MSRSILLPPYMNNAVWVALADSIDVLLSDVDATTSQLRYIRDPYAVGPKIISSIRFGSLFDTSSSEYQQDQQLLLKQLAFVGLPLSDPSFLSLTQLLMLFRHTGQYWYSKGTGAIIDFLNYTLGSSLVMTNLWTLDYKTFIPEGSPVIGLRLADVSSGVNGTWYPTTHVAIDMGQKASVFSSLSTQQFLQLFNDIFNYNLVLYSLGKGSDIEIGPLGPSASLYVEKTFYVSSSASLIVSQ